MMLNLKTALLLLDGIRVVGRGASWWNVTGEGITRDVVLNFLLKILQTTKDGGIETKRDGRCISSFHGIYHR